MRLKALVIGIILIWLVVGFLLTPVVVDIIWHVGGLPAGPENAGYALFAIILALIVVVVFAGRVKGLFNRFVACFFLVFYSFPALAWVVEPALYVMVFPVGIFALLCSPLNPLFVFPPTRRLLEVILYQGDAVSLGFWLILIGLGVFSIALIQLLRGKGRLITSGLYSVVRHPQYLGIIVVTLGFTFFEPEVRLMSLIAWIVLVFAYVWLARREETSLQEKYGENFLAYKRRVSFILPLPTSARRNSTKTTT
jgi:protein-S-isoprenylcysteine O-methyltransferase Ste14